MYGSPNNETSPLIDKLILILNQIDKNFSSSFSLKNSKVQAPNVLTKQIALFTISLPNNDAPNAFIMILHFLILRELYISAIDHHPGRLCPFSQITLAKDCCHIYFKSGSFSTNLFEIGTMHVRIIHKTDSRFS